jgi:SHS2 domain-containing protein
MAESEGAQTGTAPAEAALPDPAPVGTAPLWERWDLRRRADAYMELEHPSDLFVEVRGHDLPGLFQNALFAFYDQVAQLEDLEARRELTLSVREPRLDEALRALLSEALYRFDTEGFVAVGGQVEVQTAPSAETGAGAGWHFLARLWGQTSVRRGLLLREIKAVTYHQLQVLHDEDGWRATVLLDV